MRYNNCSFNTVGRFAVYSVTALFFLNISCTNPSSDNITEEVNSPLPVNDNPLAIFGDDAETLQSFYTESGSFSKDEIAILKNLLVYEVSDIGNLGSAGKTIPLGINEDGQIVGYSNTPSGTRHAFIWDEDTGMQDMGTLGGPQDYSIAYDINNNGQVAGYSNVPSGDIHAFIWDEVNGMVDIGTLGGNFSNAFGINDLGQVVGYSRNASAKQHAFIWDPVSGFTDLGSLSTVTGNDFSQALDINNNGEVVGQSTDDLGNTKSFYWSSSTGMIDLGTLGGNEAFAFDINEDGVIVGYNRIPTKAFKWDLVSGLVDISVNNSGLDLAVARAINDEGQITGYGFGNVGSEVILLDNGNYHVLSGLTGATASEPYAINNIGQITGISVGGSVNPRAVRGVFWNNNFDKNPPELIYNVEEDIIWPPNHKLILVISGITVSDEFDPDPELAIDVSHNEENDKCETKKKNSEEDWQVVQNFDGSMDVYVKAERCGNGEGRTYSIQIFTEDASGNAASVTEEVVVLKSKGKELDKADQKDKGNNKKGVKSGKKS